MRVIEYLIIGLIAFIILHVGRKFYKKADLIAKKVQLKEEEQKLREVEEFKKSVKLTEDARAKVSDFINE